MLRKRGWRRFFFFGAVGVVRLVGIVGVGGFFFEKI